jgi:hypothetical protein
VSPAAVTVNGARISERSLTDELGEIRDNALYRKALSLPEIGGAGREGTVQAAFTARVLTLRVYYALVDQELARRGVALTRADLDAARRELARGLGADPATGRPVEGLGDRVLNGFSRGYRDDLVRRNAAVRKLQGVLAGVDLSEAGLRRYYAAHPDEFTEVCAQHVLAAVRDPGGAVDVAASRAKIDRIAARLQSGEDFAAVARAESDDPGSRERGGDLGCADPSAYVAPFAEALRSQPIGQIGPPVQTTFGFHVVRVYGRRTASFSAVRDRVLQRLEQQSGEGLNRWLTRALARARVRVNPKFGTFVHTPEPGECAGGLPCVVPPQAPATGGAATTGG